MEFWHIVIFIGVIVLLPIVPAFLFYKYLPPDKTVVKGPFKGMDVKLQGAFAAYFLTLLFIAGFGWTTLSRISYYELWNVEGTIQLSDGGSDLQDTSILVRPPDQLLYPNGRFFIKKLLQGNNGAEKASLVVQKEGYRIETLIISKSTAPQPGFKDYNIQFHKKDKIISIEKPIVLEKVAGMVSYNELEATAAVPIEEERQ